MAERDDNTPDFVKGFVLDDLDFDADFGFSAVDDPLDSKDEDTETTTASGASAEVLDDIRNRLDDINAILQETQSLETQRDVLLATAINTETENVNEKLATVEKMILPVLLNLIKPESVDKPYIHWPNRKEVVEKQIARILKVTRG